MMNITNKINKKIVPSQIKGFTLLEALLVLFITGFILGLFSSSLSKTVKLVKNELFILEFEKMYHSTQTDAAILGQPQTLRVKNKILSNDYSHFSVPDDIQMSEFVVTFNDKGGNSSLTRININILPENKTIIYQMEMGSGKYKKTIN